MQTNDRIVLAGPVGCSTALLAPGLMALGLMALGLGALACTEAPGGGPASPQALGVARAALSEQELLRNVALDPNVETGAQSTHPGYRARRATDGDTDTAVGPAHSWTNSTDLRTGLLPQWLDVSLAGKRRVRGALLYTSSGYELRDYRLQVWADAGWLTVAERLGNADTIIEHAFAPIVTDKVRLLALGGPDVEAHQVRVNELELIGTDIEDADVAGDGEGATQSDPGACFEGRPLSSSAATEPIPCPSPAPPTCAECLTASSCPTCLYWAGAAHELELPRPYQVAHVDVYYRANGVFRRRTLTDLVPVDGGASEDTLEETDTPDDELIADGLQHFDLTDRLNGIAGSSVAEVRAFMTTSPTGGDRLTFLREQITHLP